MPTAIFDIIQKEALLNSYTVEDTQVTKDFIEGVIRKLTGLQIHQYDVSYVDQEDDKIMTIT